MVALLCIFFILSYKLIGTYLLFYCVLSAHHSMNLKAKLNTQYPRLRKSLVLCCGIVILPTVLPTYIQLIQKMQLKTWIVEKWELFSVNHND